MISMDRDLIEAFSIDFTGLLLYGGVLSTIASPPLGLSAQQLMGVGLIFPLLAYVVTYKRYPEQFWKAFFGSVVLGAVLLIGGFWLFMNMVF